MDVEPRRQINDGQRSLLPNGANVEQKYPQRNVAKLQDKALSCEANS
jgi:hypothetical protein